MPSERKPSSKPALGLIPKASRFELRRTVLLEAFTALGDARIVALVAPSGFGKTTLLAQLARESEAQTIWCELPAIETGSIELTRALLRTFGADVASENSDELSQTLMVRLEKLPNDFLIVLERADHLNAEAGA